MFQQTNRPVPVVYTLQTEFQLCNNEKVFMMDPKNYDQEMSDYDYKGSFTKGRLTFDEHFLLSCSVWVSFLF